MLEDAINSLAFGHYRITDEVHAEYAAEGNRNPVINANEAKVDGHNASEHVDFEEYLAWHDSAHMDDDSGLFDEGNPGEGEARSPMSEPPPWKTARVSKRQ